MSMEFWLTIEVESGPIATAADWRRSHGELLIEAALTNGAKDWDWTETRWGVVLEIRFDGEESLTRFRDLPAVTAALDAVPDPVNGLFVYPGRGGGAGARNPRTPRPTPIAGAAEAEEPHDQFVDLCGEADYGRGEQAYLQATMIAK